MCVGLLLTLIEIFIVVSQMLNERVTQQEMSVTQTLSNAEGHIEMYILFVMEKEFGWYRVNTTKSLNI